MKKPESEFVNFLVEQLEDLGEICVKRLFGGYSLSFNDVPFALGFDDV